MPWTRINNKHLTYSPPANWSTRLTSSKSPRRSAIGTAAAATSRLVTGMLVGSAMKISLLLVDSSRNGARVVSLSFGRWDWHGQPHGTNFDNARDHLPALDQALSALLDDLKERDMDQDVSVVVWGEFGRTPRVNKYGGRDHWPRVGCALLAGGGMRTGQMVGATNPRAEHATRRPVHFQEVFATLYQNLGIDIGQVTIDDREGRPQHLVDVSKYAAMPELI